MRQKTALVFFMLMIVIHTMDMELTRYYVGENWEFETFYPMSMTIKAIGIYKALWVSRIIMYLYFFYFLMNKNKKWVQYAMITTTILYWTAMAPWLFTLGVLEMPARVY